MRRILTLIIALFYLSCCLTARERTDSVALSEGDTLTVSLLTCDPGPDVYELCGHTALRIRSQKMDSVWNYGIFDFDAPNFIYRFCKGQTDYIVCGYPTEYFIPAYARRGSTVTEQVLNLTQEESRRLLGLLRTEALPQNRTYRYNYVRDNCATRPWKRVNEASGRQIITPDTLYFHSFREEMRHFHRKYPWYQFGIDLALGNGIDRPLSEDEDTFAPPVLAAKVAGSTIAGDSLVKDTRVLFQGLPDATLEKTPWYLTPVAAGVIMLLLSIAALLFRGAGWSRIWISAYFLLCAIGGCVISFLVFCSEHEATAPNWLIIWLNPLQLIIGIGIWCRKFKRPVCRMAACDWFVGLFILSVFICRFMVPSIAGSTLAGQVANPAILLMALCLIPLSVAILIGNRNKEK